MSQAAGVRTPSKALGQAASRTQLGVAGGRGEGNVSEKGQERARKSPGLGGREVSGWPSRAQLGDQVCPRGPNGIGRWGPSPAQPGSLFQAGWPARITILGCVLAAGRAGDSGSKVSETMKLGFILPKWGHCWIQCEGPCEQWTEAMGPDHG